MPMGFLTFIVRNMLGRPGADAAHASWGSASGIAAVMMLTGISWGFERSLRRSTGRGGST